MSNSAASLSLSIVHYYLDLAIDVSHEQCKTVMAGVYGPSPPSVRKVCLLFAMHMAECKSPTLDAPAKPSMDMLRRALDQVRNHEAIVDLEGRKVYCKTAGDVIDFN